MAGRCGCSGASAGANIRGRYGVDVTGTGMASDPAVARFDPRVDNILGNGLQWNEPQHQMSARLSNDAGNTLRYGTDGGLWTTGTGDGGGGEPVPPPTSGATVNALPATGMVAGIDGGGYLLTGDSTQRAARSALELDVDAAYIPVRALSDGAVVVWPHSDTTLARMTQQFARAGHPDYSQRTPEGMTALEWRHVPLMAGAWRASGFDPATGQSALLDPAVGYVGSGESPQMGGTFLCDVARDIGGATVLVLHVEDPATYAGVREVIVNHGLRDSVVVVSSRTAMIETWVAEDMPAGLYNDSDYGPTPPNAGDIVAVGGEWALLGVDRSDAVFQAYRDAGVHTLAMWARYHSDHARVASLGIRGAVTGDPVYYRGPDTGYAYKAAGNNVMRFDGPQQQPGMFTAHHGHGDVTPARRGHKGNGDYWLLDRDTNWRTWHADSQTTYGTYFLQMGPVCPIVPGAPTDSYALIVAYDWVRAPNNIAATSSVSIAFGVPTDHAMSDGGDSYRGALDKGYVLMEQFNGNLMLFQLNGADPPTPMASGNVGAHYGDELVTRGIILQQDRIVITNGVDETPLLPAFEVTSTPSWHGGYCYIGKRDYQVDSANDGRTQIRVHRFEAYTPWPQ